MALGLLVGSVLEEVLSPDLVSMIDTYALRSVRTMFLNAMNMMLAPVVLFSIMAGICHTHGGFCEDGRQLCVPYPAKHHAGQAVRD
jgi:Na+/H+-dicarboxylate symporter